MEGEETQTSNAEQMTEDEFLQSLFNLLQPLEEEQAHNIFDTACKQLGIENPLGPFPGEEKNIIDKIKDRWESIKRWWNKNKTFIYIGLGLITVIVIYFIVISFL